MQNVVKPITKNQGWYNTRYQHFGNEFVKVTCCSQPVFNGDALELHTKKDRPTVDKPKNMDNPVLDRSVKRAQDKVMQIGYSNDFQWFVTLTLDETKVERSNIEEIRKRLLNWLKHKVERNDLKYLIVPEYHEDKQSIHFHGLMSGNLDMVDSGTVSVPKYKKPMKAAKAQRLGLTGNTVYNLENWHYGFTTAIETYGNRGACINYFIKYITKDSKKILGHFYLAGGKGLVRKVPTLYSKEDYRDFESQFESRLDEYHIRFKYRFDKGENDEN